MVITSLYNNNPQYYPPLKVNLARLVQSGGSGNPLAVMVLGSIAEVFVIRKIGPRIIVPGHLLV